MDDGKDKIIKLYNAFNAFYYDGLCVPEYSNLHFNIDFLEDGTPDEIDGRTDLTFNTEKDEAEITIRIKKEITQQANNLHLSAVLLHEMVHANLYANHIYELNEEKTEAIHGEKFYQTAISHGLKDGYMIPNDEIILIMGRGKKWK